MAYSKIILNGETLMDVTSDTVAAGSLLSGKTATKNDGTKVTGNIASKTASDLTASGATVTADKTWQEIYDAFPNVYVCDQLGGKQCITRVSSLSNQYDVYIYGYSSSLRTNTPTGYPSRTTEK